MDVSLLPFMEDFGSEVYLGNDLVKFSKIYNY